MPRILLLVPTTTYRTHAFMEAARRVGVEVTVASERASALATLNPSGLLTLTFRNPQQAARQVVEFSAQHPIDAVVAVDDQVTLVGAAICQALSLRHNSVPAVLAARNKHAMRELLDRAGVPQPRYRLASLADDLASLADQIDYPCVIKPLSLSASRGVIRADDQREFMIAVERLAAILRTESHPPSAVSVQDSGLDTEDSAAADGFLVEHFLAGPEVALEGLLSRGRLRVLALFDKPDPLDGPFFEETIYVTPSRLPALVQHEVAQCAERACRAIGLAEGPVHAELRFSTKTTHDLPRTAQQSGGPCVIEVNARSIGGLCSRVLRFGTGISLEELIIRHALHPTFSPPAREGQAAGVMMIPIPRAGVLREVRGLAAARDVAGIEEVTISTRVGQELIPLPEGGLYLGFLFARGESPDKVEAALRTAHVQLDFVIEPPSVPERNSGKDSTHRNKGEKVS